MAIIKVTVKKVRLASVQQMALQYTAYIVKTHCTLDEAAKHFGVPRSTLWWRLEQLPHYDREPTKRIAAENKVRTAMHALEILNRRKNK